MLVIVNVLRAEGQLVVCLLFFLGSFVLSWVRGTLLGGDTSFGRAVWEHVSDNSNDLATLCLLAPGIDLCLLFAGSDPVIVRLGGTLSTILLLVGILLTQSRRRLSDWWAVWILPCFGGVHGHSRYSIWPS